MNKTHNTTHIEGLLWKWIKSERTHRKCWNKYTFIVSVVEAYSAHVGAVAFECVCVFINLVCVFSWHSTLTFFCVDLAPKK